MAGDDARQPAERRLFDASTGRLEAFVAGAIAPGAPIVCAAHPAGVLAASAAELLRDTAAATAVCVNPRGIGGSSAKPASEGGYPLASMVDDLEAARRVLGVEAWVFWGMSGGGWLGLEYALRRPPALRGLIVESVCPCFRERLADPACVLSPFHPSWRAALQREGLLAPDSHRVVGDPAATAWLEVAGVGSVFRRRDGPALLVSPQPVTAEMRSAMPLLWTLDFRSALAAIRTPTLLIAGADDPIVPPAHVRSLHEAIAGAEYLLVEGAAHVPTTARRPEVADAVRRFLRRLGG